MQVGEDEAAGPEGSAIRQKIVLGNFLSQLQNEKNSNGEVKMREKSDSKGDSKEKMIKAANKTIHERKADNLVQNSNENTINNDKIMDQKLSINNNDSDNKGIIQDWQKLQHALLQNSALLLPNPIDRSNTARGFSGLPPDQTPALEGAKRGTISCPDVDPRINEVISSMLAFWNEPRGTRDVHGEYYSAQSTDEKPQQHPFIPKPLEHLTKENLLETIQTSRRRYLTFEPDRGAFNNIAIPMSCRLLLRKQARSRCVCFVYEESLFVYLFTFLLFQECSL